MALFDELIGKVKFRFLDQKADDCHLDTKNRCNAIIKANARKNNIHFLQRFTVAMTGYGKPRMVTQQFRDYRQTRKLSPGVLCLVLQRIV